MRLTRFIGNGAAALVLLATVMAVPAEARRGGSFGSRGSRTYSAPRATRLAPGYTPPVARTMTARPARDAYGDGAPSYRPRPRLGFGGGLLAGLVTGGLIGGLFGHHWGGGYGYGYGYGGGIGGGLLATLLQLALIGGAIWLALRLFRGRPTPQPYPQPAHADAGRFVAPPAYAAAPAPPTADIALTAADQDMFERLLIELQDAFAREDYARLRAITTPEVMSYLAEELGDNATRGRRNEVTGTRLLDGEVSEAWREGDADYATIVMRYESVDTMRDRATGAALPGQTTGATATTELWTFMRPPGAWNGWKVAAIQDA